MLEARSLKIVIKQAGGPSAVSRRTGFSRQAIHSWINRGDIPRATRRKLEAAGISTTTLLPFGTDWK